MRIHRGIVIFIVPLLFLSLLSFSQKVNFKDGYPNSIKPVGIIKDIADSTLLELVQRQTFRYFWHFGHRVSALLAFLYTPEYFMQALKHFYYNLGDRIWSEYGFVDGFSIDKNWYAKSHLAIDQGPIVVMIENYRTGLLWNLFMNIPDVQNGLKKLGFTSPRIKQ